MDGDPMEQQRTEALDLLSHEADTFIETINTLRSLKEVTHPQAQTLDENPLWQSAVSRQASVMDADKRGTFIATMIEATPLVMAILNGAGRTFVDLEDTDETDWEPVAPIDVVPHGLRDAIQETHDELAGELDAEPDFRLTRAGSGSYRVEFHDPAIRWHFWAAVREMEKGAATPTHAALLMRSILTMGVSAFEVLIANLYRSLLLCHAGAAENPDTKAFSLRDLFDFGSIEDAVRESIRQQADNFSRQGIRAWASSFKSKPLQIDVQELAYDWPRTQELFERRNVVIHNGSRVTRQYLNHVDSSLVKGLAEGTAIELTPQYVDESLERLLTLGTLLAYRVRLKLFRKENATAISEWISDTQFDFITRSEFQAVRQVARCACNDPDLLDTHRNLLKVNGWIAQMRLDGVDSCRSEVEAWDTSALNDRYKAARLVLLRHDEAALELLKNLVKDGDFTVDNLREWPLFHWMRADGVLDEIIGEDAAQLGAGTVDVVVRGAIASDARESPDLPAVDSGSDRGTAETDDAVEEGDDAS